MPKNIFALTQNPTTMLYSIDTKCNNNSTQWNINRERMGCEFFADNYCIVYLRRFALLTFLGGKLSKSDVKFTVTN